MKEGKHVKAKICLVGQAAVGKTSLIRRYVVDQFDDKYVATLGTKVTKRVVEVPIPNGGGLHARVELLIWDVMGQPKIRELLDDLYFQGAAGILAVADCTRRATLDALVDWLDRVNRITNRAPIVLAVNKSDLKANAEFGPAEVGRLVGSVRGGVLETSAKTGENVEEAFRRLALFVLDRSPAPG
jgi:small GTP-binding protein